jgi:hypothetical protein
MIEKIVRDELNTRVWSFSEIANVSNTIETLTQTVYDRLPTTDKLKLVWDVEVFAEEMTFFGELYTKTIMAELRVMVADIVKDELSKAKVAFSKTEIKIKEDNKNVPKGSLGGKSYKKRTADEKKDSEE